jgi:hypothetical protein
MEKDKGRYSANYKDKDEESSRASEYKQARPTGKSKGGRVDREERRSQYKASTFHKRNDRALLTWQGL